VDVAALTGGSAPHVLLVQRAHPPFAGEWALPGGFVDEGERVAHAAARELAEETGLKLGSLSLLGVYDTPGRDPRGWTVSITYLAVLPTRAPVTGGDDAREARWFSADTLPKLAFDHATIIGDALVRWAEQADRGQGPQSHGGR
jgi:8-oxo-dGTP diphosphatase